MIDTNNLQHCELIHSHSIALQQMFKLYYGELGGMEHPFVNALLEAHKECRRLLPKLEGDKRYKAEEVNALMKVDVLPTMTKFVSEE